MKQVRENEQENSDADEEVQENQTGKNIPVCDIDHEWTECFFPDIGGLQKKLAQLKDELMFWRRSDRVSRQCLKALLQERLTVNQEDLEGPPRAIRPLETRIVANSSLVVPDDSSLATDPAAIGVVLDCLRCFLV